MNKRVISLFLAIALVFVTAFSSLAATKTGILRPVDLRRFQRCVSNVRGKNAKVINYQQLADGSYMVHLRVRDNNFKGDQCEGDYKVSFYGTKAPEKNLSFGPCWYWFGVFGDAGTAEASKIVGYGLAVREYQAMAAKHYVGYTQPDGWCNEMFQ